MPACGLRSMIPGLLLPERNFPCAARPYCFRRSPSFGTISSADGNMLGNDGDRAGEQLRGRLNVMYGDLLPDLQELDVSRQWQQFGRVFPIFETALHPPTERHGGVTYDALRFAVSALEPAIGRLSRMAHEGAPVHHTFWIAAFVLTFVAGWLVRHYRDRLILLRRLPAVATGGNTKVLLIALAVAGGGITGNLFAGLGPS
jgi:hypothetical protein